MGGAFDLCALGQNDRLFKIVPILPMPIVVRHAEKLLAFARWVQHAIFKIFAATVHVRVQAGELHVRSDFKTGIHAIVGMTGRDFESAVGGRQSKHPFFRQLLCKDDAES